VATHPLCCGRRQRLVDPAHLQGLVGSRPIAVPPADVAASQAPALLRPLGEYEALVGGGF